jgi:hypothetical protein
LLNSQGSAAGDGENSAGKFQIIELIDSKMQRKK